MLYNYFNNNQITYANDYIANLIANTIHNCDISSEKCSTLLSFGNYKVFILMDEFDENNSSSLQLMEDWEDSNLLIFFTN